MSSTIFADNVVDDDTNEGDDDGGGGGGVVTMRVEELWCLSFVQLVPSSLTVSGYERERKTGQWAMMLVTNIHYINT